MGLFNQAEKVKTTRDPLSTNLLGRRGIWVFGLLTLILVWVASAVGIMRNGAQTEAAAQQNGRNLARAFEEHIVRSLRAVDQTLLYIRESYAKNPQAFDITLWQRESRLLSEFAFQVSLVDKDGFVITTNLDPAARLNISDREHFRVQKDGGKDEMFVSKPVLGRVSKRWSINVTRRITNGNGEFAGVAVVSLDPEYLARFYNSIDVGRLGTVLLAGTDGIVRARASHGERTANGSLVGAKLLPAFEKANEGSFFAKSAIDSIPRLFSYRGVHGYPLIVVVGLATDEIFERFRSDRDTYIAVVFTFSVLFIGLLWVLQRYQSGLRRTRDELRERELSALQKSEQLGATLDNMSQGILMVDGAGAVPVINHRAVELLGLPDSFATSPPRFDEILQWQAAHGEFRSDEEASLARPPVYERERPNGTVLEIRSKPIGGGGMVRTYSDITDRKRNEKALAEARDAAESASRAQSSFLAMVSHELRTPMNAVIGLSEALLETELDQTQLQHARIIEQSVEHLLGIINNILDFSSLEAGHEKLELVAFNVHDLVDNVLDIGKSLPYGLQLSVAAEIDSNVPACLFGDPGRLSQILLNLVSNGIKYTHQGSVRLFLTVASHDSGKMWLRFSVHDTGIGIAPEVLGKLFQPFERGDIVDSYQIGGTGLGLAIVKKLAESLGGHVSVKSEIGVGSTFTCELPFELADISAVPLKTRPAAFEITRKLRILVAEDTLANQMVIRSMLDKLGHHVQVVANGAEAVKLASEASYDLILMDVQMPVMNGYLASAAIRKLDGSKGLVPIVALTAFAQPADRERALKAGMTDYLRKPIRRADIQRTIARIFAFEKPLAVPQAAAFDGSAIDQLRKDFGNEQFKKLLRQFQKDAETCTVDLEAAIADKKIPLVRNAAHAMSGLFGQFGIEGLAETATGVEISTGDDILEQATTLAVGSHTAIKAIRERYSP
jgi:signal transduction histidine kinase/CheY-like chemotaxis protein/HPt (histidine-containing phosphotransfer) domain-containing protein